MSHTVIKPATIRELDFIYESMRNFAEEQHVLDRFSQTKQQLGELLFHYEVAEVFIAYQQEIPIGFTTFSLTHRNFNLFARPGLYIHDIYVIPSARHQGVATKFINFIKTTAQQRNLGRIDLVVIKENTPAVEFYQSIPEIKKVDYIQYMRITIENSSSSPTFKECPSFRV